MVLFVQNLQDTHVSQTGSGDVVARGRGRSRGWVSSWGHENVLEPERQRQRLHNTANVLNATEPSTGTWLVFWLMSILSQ